MPTNAAQETGAFCSLVLGERTFHPLRDISDIEPHRIDRVILSDGPEVPLPFTSRAFSVGLPALPRRRRGRAQFKHAVLAHSLTAWLPKRTQRLAEMLDTIASVDHVWQMARSRRSQFQSTSPTRVSQLNSRPSGYPKLLTPAPSSEKLDQIDKSNPDRFFVEEGTVSSLNRAKATSHVVIDISPSYTTGLDDKGNLRIIKNRTIDSVDGRKEMEPELGKSGNGSKDQATPSTFRQPPKRSATVDIAPDRKQTGPTFAYPETPASSIGPSSEDSLAGSVASARKGKGKGVDSVQNGQQPEIPLVQFAVTVPPSKSNRTKHRYRLSAICVSGTVLSITTSRADGAECLGEDP